MFVKKLGLLLLSSSLLVACGGSDSVDITLPDVTPPVTGTPDPIDYNHQVTGIVAYQGAIAGADVCIDINMNTRCDTDEPASTTDNDGLYQIDWVNTTETPTYYLIANWIETNNSLPSQPQLLSSTFKASERKLFSNLNDSHSVDDNDNAQLISLSDHGGAINALTHLEFQRYEQMLAQGLSTDAIQALRQQLKIILDALYSPLNAQAYQVTADISDSEAFVSTYSSHLHIAGLIGDRLTATLAIDEVLSASKDAIEYLVLKSGISFSEYLASDPIDVRFLVSDTLIAQGYIATLFDEKLMSAADWQTVQTNMLNDEVKPNKFYLAPAHHKSSYSLKYGNPQQMLFGDISDGALTGAMIDTSNMQLTAMACWNEQLEKWINPDRSDQGYAPIAAEYVNNTVNTHYEGTQVAMNLKIEKHQTNSATWLAILNSLPSQFKLNELQWPNFVYRYHIEQTADVMCRTATNFNTWDMPQHYSPQMLTTADIARLFWTNFYPNNVIIDEDNHQFSVHYAAGETRTFEWALTTSPTGSAMIRMVEINLPVGNIGSPLPTEYLIEGAHIIEVEIHRASSFDDMNDYLFISYDGEEDNFSQRFFEHLMALGANTQP